MASLCFRVAVCYILLGMAIGIFMGITGQYHFDGLHAHLNLLGFVLIMAFGFYYKAYPEAAGHNLAKTQFAIYNAGVVLTLGAFAMLLNGHEQYEVVMRFSNPLIFIGTAMFGWIVFKTSKS